MGYPRFLGEKFVVGGVYEGPPKVPVPIKVDEDGRIEVVGISSGGTNESKLLAWDGLDWAKVWIDPEDYLQIVSRSYNRVLDGDEVIEKFPLNLKSEVIDFADVTNVSVSTYYPSDEGLDMAGYRKVSVTGKLIDGDAEISFYVTGTNDTSPDPADRDWIQVYGYDAKNNKMSNVVTVLNGTITFAWDFDDWNYKYFRIHLIINGATNTVRIKGSRIAL